jgi:catechol 2,3-dioxygenase-like lactoylglutathione lyase family enzyme
MSLASLETIAFIPSTDFAAARAFYEGTLGLTFVSEDGHALVFSLGPHHQMLRISKAPGFTPLPFTQFGWQVTDIHATVSELAAKGIELVRFSFFQQDEDGVWTAPNGSKVAWFKDPDGNTLSLSYHPA